MGAGARRARRPARTGERGMSEAAAVVSLRGVGKRFGTGPGTTGGVVADRREHLDEVGAEERHVVLAGLGDVRVHRAVDEDRGFVRKKLQDIGWTLVVLLLGLAAVYAMLWI